MSIQVRYAAFSDVGLVRLNNQDGAYASQNLLVVADGMGGAAAGDVASSVTIAHLASIDDDVHPADDLLPLLRVAIEDAHNELLNRAQEDSELEGLGTTCTAILRSDNKLAMVHIGDSRAYVLHEDELVQVTHDHTLVQYLVDKGDLTPEEAEVHPKRNIIMRALGDFPGEVELDESVREAIAGDRWLLCSDGLYGYVSAETIERTLKETENIEECGERLISFALAAGAPDNVTIVLADIIEETQLLDSFSPQKPVVVGSAAVDFMRPTRGGDSAAGQAAALTASLRKDDSETQNEIIYPETPNHRGAKIAVLIGVLVLIIALLVGGYRWSQAQYYVSTSQGKIAIYQGIPSKVVSFELSHIVEETDVKVRDLTPTARERLDRPIARSSLKEAREVVENLRASSDVPAGDKQATPSPSTSNTNDVNDVDAVNGTEDAKKSGTANTATSSTQPSPSKGVNR
ncbi:MAG: Stp1/IreP family PP2C-type Ser/Thr phosphatase [Actinomycetaceae bacterium]|nr:Stp1/IreP family PP2C-type Ser/Thr phosphatase [Actinomycetaceae bacterium]